MTESKVISPVRTGTLSCIRDPAGTREGVEGSRIRAMLQACRDERHFEADLAPMGSWLSVADMAPAVVAAQSTAV